MNEKIKVAGKVLVGVPKNPPLELINQISNYLELQNNVYIAYMLQMYRENELSYLLILGFQKEDESIIQEISRISEPFLDKYNMDICPLETRFEMTAIKDKEPFFRA